MDDPPLPDEGDRVREPERDGPALEAYEAGGDVVLYDPENPLAWLQGSDPLPLHEQV